MNFTFRVGKIYARLGRLTMFVAVAFVLATSSIAFALTMPEPIPGSDIADPVYSGINGQYMRLLHDTRSLQDQQKQARIQVVGDTQLQQLLSDIQGELTDGELVQADADMTALQASLAKWQSALANRQGTLASAPKASRELSLPIVLYHYTPPNFEAQLEHLEKAGYTVIDLDQAIAGLHGAPLPAKPVVLTFDDGFANQMQAFEILKRHNMKATFYIINGGVTSRWCIGAGRRYNDPLQPPKGCGDAYLNWDQVRMLDQSGLITIGGHTLDHENLATLSADEQRRQIIDSKTQIEQEIGHPIKHFAYPYGAFNQTSIQIVREAGYESAVTVEPGAKQTSGSDFTLKRVRDTLSLP